MIKKFIFMTLLLLAAVVVRAEQLYSFAVGKNYGNPSIAADKQGYQTKIGADGLTVNYAKFDPAVKSPAWQVINLNSKDLKTKNWSSFNTLVLKLENKSDKFTPVLEFYVRDNSNKIFSVRKSLAIGTNQLVIPISEMATKINPEKVSMIQMAISRPSGGTLRFITLDLTAKDAASAVDGKTLFSFASGQTFPNKSVPANLRNYVAEQTSTGLLVKYGKPAPKLNDWPVINIDGMQLAARNWQDYGDVVLTIQNFEKELSPKLQFIVRDDKNKIFIQTLIVRCNHINKLIIPTADIAAKIDIKKINMIQLAFSKPPKDFAVEFKALYLCTSTKPDEKRLVKKYFDFLPALTNSNQGFYTNGETKITGETKSRQAHFTRHQEGFDKWPGFGIYARMCDAVERGDLSTKTHLVMELAEKTDSGSGGLGFTMADNHNKKIWVGIGAIKGHTVIEHKILGLGVDLASIRSINFGCYIPANSFDFNIKKFGFEFRPESIMPEVVQALQTLLKERISDDNRRKTQELLTQITTLYHKVKGSEARYNDIRQFIGITGKVPQFVQQIMRQENSTMLSKMISDYGYGAGLADSMTSVYLENAGFKMRPAAEGEALEMAANEYESFQVIVAAGKNPLKKMHIQVKLPAPLEASVSVVGFSKTVQPEYSAAYVGYNPDFLIEYQKNADAQPHDTVPYWVRIKAPKGTKAGDYKGSITISGEGVKSFTFPVTVKVFDFTLPDGSPLPSSNNFHLSAIRTIYKIKNENEYRDLCTKFIDMAADYKISYDMLYSGPYTSLNKATDIAYPRLKSLNDKGLLRSYCILNSTVRDSSIVDPNHPEVAKQLERSRKHMDYWLKVAKENGVDDKAYLYGFDEGRTDAVFIKVLGTLRKEYKFPVMTTAGLHDINSPAIEHIGIWVQTARTYRVNEKLIKELRAKGKKVWWYVCNFPRPPEPTMLLEVPGAVPRLLMGAMSWKYQPEGFLYWAVIAWMSPKGRTPVNFGPRTDWNPATCYADNGEGNLFVPGSERRILPTIRVENFRDGVEDLWYFNILNDLAKKKDKLNDSQVRKALTIEPELVTRTDQYTTDPAIIRAKRRAVARLIEELK